MALDSIEKLRALGDPLRLQLLLLLSEPHTAKTAAAQLNVPTTRLYYHLQMLEDHGFIQVVRRRKVSGIEERTYQSTASGWTISPGLAASSLESAGVLASMLNLIHAEMAIALEEDPDSPVGGGKSPVPLLGLTPLAFTPQQLDEFVERITNLLEEYVWAGPTAPAGARLYHSFTSVYPISIPGSRRAARD